MHTSQMHRTAAPSSGRRRLKSRMLVGWTALILASTPMAAHAAVPTWIVKFSVSGVTSWIMKQYYESRGYTCYKVLPWWFCARTVS